MYTAEFVKDFEFHEMTETLILMSFIKMMISLRHCTVFHVFITSLVPMLSRAGVTLASFPCSLSLILLISLIMIQSPSWLNQSLCQAPGWAFRFYDYVSDSPPGLHCYCCSVCCRTIWERSCSRNSVWTSLVDKTLKTISNYQRI